MELIDYVTAAHLFSRTCIALMSRIYAIYYEHISTYLFLLSWFHRIINSILHYQVELGFAWRAQNIQRQINIYV
jgi:hypothetical protein